MSISEAYQVECVGDKAKGEIIVMVWTCIDERQWIYWTKDVEDRAASRKKRGMYGLLYCRRTFRGLMWQRMLSGIKINKQTNITTTKKHHWFYTVQFSKSQIFGHVCWMTVYISIFIVISVTLCEYKVFSVFLAIWLKKKKKKVQSTGYWYSSPSWEDDSSTKMPVKGPTLVFLACLLLSFLCTLKPKHVFLVADVFYGNVTQIGLEQLFLN